MPTARVLDCEVWVAGVPRTLAGAMKEVDARLEPERASRPEHKTHTDGTRAPNLHGQLTWDLSTQLTAS